MKAIIFDFFGVIAVSDTWQDFLDSLPADIDKEPLHALNHQHDSGALSTKDFLYRIHDLTGHEPAQLEEIVQTDNMKNHALLAYIKTELKPHYKIGLLSNVASDWPKSQFLSDEEQALFDDMVFSYEVGLTKPNLEIFRLASERIGVQPEDIIFTDDIIDNVEAAQRFGMQAVLYRNLHEFRQRVIALTQG